MRIARPHFFLFLVFILPFAGGCGQADIDTTDEISRHIRSILQLPTFEHVYRDVVYLDRERSFLIFKTMDTETLFAVNVRIQAGLDLREGFTLEQTQDGLRVNLPPARILLADADESSIEQYFLKEVGGSISRLDYYDEINRMKEELILDSLSRGILEKALENAKLLVTNFLNNSGFEKVIFAEDREPDS